MQLAVSWLYLRARPHNRAFGAGLGAPTPASWLCAGHGGAAWADVLSQQLGTIPPENSQGPPGGCLHIAWWQSVSAPASAAALLLRNSPGTGIKGGLAVGEAGEARILLCPLQHSKLSGLGMSL